MTDNIHDLKAHLANAALDGNAANTADVSAILTPEIEARFTAARVHVDSVRGAVLEELAKGRTAAEIASDIENDLVQFERQKAETDAAQALTDAKYAAEQRRVERLTTASIVLGHLIADYPSTADRNEIVDTAVDFADRLLAKVAN